ncbi:MAG: CapA family protein [Lachnospiraceae bacterium]|nr:CapA family protein [Lachnospiraceae bacterium]
MNENGLNEDKMNKDKLNEDKLNEDIFVEITNSNHEEINSGSAQINKKKRSRMVIAICLLMALMGTFAYYAFLQLDRKTAGKTENVQVGADVEGNIAIDDTIKDDDVGTYTNQLEVNDTNAETENTEKKNTEKEDISNDTETHQTTSAEIVMVGDVLLHTPVSDSGLMEDGTYHYDHLFANVKDEISAADLAIVNQEVILGGRELGLSGYPTFNGAYEVGDALVAAGFDVILHATNHALDQGKTGIINCLNFWRTNYPEIGVIGINDSEEMQNEVYIKEVNGIKIAILNYTYGTNGINMPSDMPFAVNLIDRDKIAKDLAIAREQADFIIVCPHWGIEYTHHENSDQTELAQFLAEQGADLIMGAHPHVIQPVRWVEASNGNQALVYYSLGNFINATSEYGSGVADRMIGAMADVTIEMDGTGDVKIADYHAVPLVTQMLTGSGRITTYLLSDYNEELAGQNEVNERDDAFSYDYCVRVSSEVLGE